MLADEHGPYIPFYLSVVCSFEPEKIYDPYVEIFSGYATPLDHSGCYLSHQSQSQLMHTQRVIKPKLGPKKAFLRGSIKCVHGVTLTAGDLFRYALSNARDGHFVSS